MTAVLRTQCCIVGSGPAGAMLGLLLARQGVDVVVLERHADFLRDFRGDTVHPSTLEILDELGLAEAFLDLRPNRAAVLVAETPGGRLTMADFRRLDTRYPFIAFIPQWDFLEFLTGQGRREAGFRLLMQTEATGLIESGGTIRGVRFVSPDGDGEVRAPLTVAADGRSSVIRAEAGLPLSASAPPIDVLWFRLPRMADDSPTSIGYAGRGHVVALIDRSDYWQIAYVIPKGAARQLREQGIEALARSLGELVPELRGRAEALTSWDQVSLLTVRADRLRRWYRPGLLCIGDAAHAMSPVGGLGINVAIQDAVVAANLLAAPLRRGRITTRQLAAVQRRRAWQVRAMQLLQALAARVALNASLAGPARRSGLASRLGGWLMRRPSALTIRSRLIGLGLRRVHVRRAPPTRRGAAGRGVA